jgi:hypothetical protein
MNVGEQATIHFDTWTVEWRVDAREQPYQKVDLSLYRGACSEIPEAIGRKRSTPLL